MRQDSPTLQTPPLRAATAVAVVSVLAAATLFALGPQAHAQPPEPTQLPEPGQTPGFPGSRFLQESGLPDFSGPPEGPVYTWKDGDRTRRVFLQPDLVIAADGAIAASGREAPQGGPGLIVSASSADAVGGHPVFRSQSGSMMTLPGGVLLIFDGAWGEAETDAFFARQGISRDRVGPLGEIPNGFTVETAPGFASLVLANSLAELEGVVVASPNWWQELVTK